MAKLAVFIQERMRIISVGAAVTFPQAIISTGNKEKTANMIAETAGAF